MSIVRKAISERRTVIKDELWGVFILALVNRSLKSLVFSPKLED
jgi:hypothetical protein